MAMIFYGVLDMLMKKWNLNENPALKNDLLAGQGDVESTLPMKEIQKIDVESVYALGPKRDMDPLSGFIYSRREY